LHVVGLLATSYAGRKQEVPIMSFRFSRVLTAAILSTGVLTAALSSAQDAKRLGGASCSYADTRPTAASNHGFFKRHGGFNNASGIERDVVCPIVKDKIGGQLTSVVALTSVGDVSCRINRISHTGTTSFQSFLPTRETQAGTFTQWVEWLTPMNASSEAVSVVCSLPPQGTIYYVQSSEPN
jgi:hypothetical protein